MLIISLLGPLVSSVLCLYLPRQIGRLAGNIMVMLFVTSTLSSLLLTYYILQNNVIVILTLLRFSTALGITWEISLDHYSCTLLSIVLIVSTCVNSYSLYYMANDATQMRFLGLMSSFTSYMLLLILSNNIVTLFLNWELIGVLSYLLIHYWSDRIAAVLSAIKTMLINKLGDYLITIALIIIVSQISTSEFTMINTLYNFTSSTDLHYYSNIVFYTLLFGACAKSAQIGLHLWLADAMNGPTPVSSLLHAATLVVSGPILLYKVLLLTNYNVTLLQFIGITSSLLGSLLALAQTDSKAIIAYSTMSQFGLIISVSSLYSITSSQLHIINHAAFKACLFMSIGLVIHSLHDAQDYRAYGSMAYILPITYASFLASTASLIALPYLSGNISKELIIELHSTQYATLSQFAYVVSLIITMLTVLYSIRLLLVTFYSTSNSPKVSAEQTHEATLPALLAITTLSVLGIIMGWLIFSYVVEAYDVSNMVTMAELYNIILRLIPSGIIIISLMLVIFLFTSPVNSRVILANGLYKALYMRFYWDTLYNSFYYSYISLCKFASKTIDLGVIELVSAHGPTSLLFPTITRK